MKGKSAKRILAVLLTTLAAVGVFVAYSAVTASAQGRTIDGVLCMDHPFCMGASFDGHTVEGYQVAQNTPSGAVITVRPGTYWLTVHDDMSGHDFALRSCPGSDSPCTPGTGSGLQITTPAYNCNNDTTVADACATGVTNKILLTHGTYRLFCDVGNGGNFNTLGFHERQGMYVDIVVGGVGQVG